MNFSVSVAFGIRKTRLTSVNERDHNRDPGQR